MKFFNEKTTVDGITFDSRKEAARWQELRLMERAGAIEDLKRQVKYVLLPAQRDRRGKLLEREVSYYADFVYRENGKTVVEDVKGVRTKEYIIKRKMLLYEYGIHVREI